ncbi:methyltransferase [Ktedonobacteria bacterium brp13]|nr:methyltransferase [Ktedonobacteria bacterium brp13]
MLLQKDEESNAYDPQKSPFIILLGLVGGVRLAKAVHVAVQLGIPDLVDTTPISAKELAELTGSHERSLYRLLRAIASIGIFKEVEPTQFVATELSLYLRKDYPNTVRYMVMMMFTDSDWEAWERLDYSVRTGHSAFEHVHGTDSWTYLTSHPEEYEIFNRAMTSISDTTNASIINAYDFSTIHTLADIGGGHGKVLATILQAHPSMQGILFDLAPVADTARDVIAEAGLEERCQVIGGSFFDEIPTGADAYLLKHVLHDWDDAACKKILDACHSAMPAGTKLLIAEQVLPLTDIPVSVASTDLSMLVGPGGCERTEQEYHTLLEASGFKIIKVHPTHALHCVVEAVAVA